MYFMKRKSSLTRPDSRRSCPLAPFWIAFALAAALLAAPLPEFFPAAPIPFSCLASSGFHGEWIVNCRLVSLPAAEPEVTLEVESSLSLAVERPDFEAGLTLDWDPEGWSNCDIEAEWTMDPLSWLAAVWFDGAAHWDRTRLAIEYDPNTIPLELSFTSDLYDDRASLRIQGESDRDPLSVDLDMRYGVSYGDPLRFERADVGISFPWPERMKLVCDTRLSADRGWDHTNVEFDFPASCLPGWLKMEFDVRLTPAETAITVEPDVSLSDLVLNHDPGSTAKLHSPLRVRLPLEVQLDDCCRFNGASVVGFVLSCESEDRWIEAAVSFDPGWNKKLAGDKRFDSRFSVGWEGIPIGSPSSTYAVCGEGYIALPPPAPADGTTADRIGELGLCGEAVMTTVSGAERSLSCRFTIPFPAETGELELEPERERELELELEIEFSSTW